MKKYRKKPVEVEAVQMTLEVLKEVRNGDMRAPFGAELDFKQYGVFLDTDEEIDEGTQWLLAEPEGYSAGEVGDWLCRGASGRCFWCPDQVFRATYEEVGT